MSTEGRPAMPVHRIGLLGYGEVGKILAEELSAGGERTLMAWDVKVGTEEEAVLRTHAEQSGVELGRSPAVFGQCDLVISAVTASQTVSAARDCAPHVSGKWFVDLNSASPGAKIAAADAIQRHDGRYVEAAVMATVAARRLGVPILLGGEFADTAMPLLDAMGFNVEIASDELGIAAATKLCRSVMIKGLEALTLECYSAARVWGVEEAVLKSLHSTFPQTDFEYLGGYFFKRTMLHGKRRAEEMREAMKTVDEAGAGHWMSEASACWQDWIARETAEQGLGRFIEESGDWRAVVDALIPPARRPRQGSE